MRELLRAVAKTAGGSAAALVMGVITAKVLAVLAGPSGVGLFSLLRQTQQLAVLLALFNGQAAIAQGLGSRADSDAQRRYLGVVFWILAVSTALVSLLFVVAAQPLARWLGGEAARISPGMVHALAPAILFGAISGFSIGVLNGYRLIGRAALVQFVNHFAVAILSHAAATMFLGGEARAFAWLLNAGAFAAAACGALLVARARLMTITPPRRTSESGAVTRHFLSMSSSLVISAGLALGVPLAMRALIIRGFGLPGAGIFDVAWTLSMSYVMLLLSAFAAYYLPTLSGIHDAGERIALIRRVLRLAMILALPLVTAAVVLKPLVIRLLYTEEFLPALTIMRWMFIGDFLKVLSWVFAVTMLAYADMRAFLTTEILWSCMTLTGALVAVRWTHSLEHIGVVFMLLYALYLAVMAVYVRRRHGYSFRQDLGRTAAALAIIVVASLLTWNDTAVRWPVAVACVVAAALMSWMLLTSAERRQVYAGIAGQRRAT